MVAKSNGTKTKVAVQEVKIEQLYHQQEDLKKGVREIKTILTEGSSKILEVRAGLENLADLHKRDMTTLYKLATGALTIIGLVIAYVGVSS